MLFDGDGLIYEDLKNMDFAEYTECVTAKTMFVQHLEALRDKNNKKGGV